MSVFSFLFGKTIFNVVKEGCLPELCAMLDKHPDRVNAVDSEGYTPLHRALMLHHNDIAAELITRGAVIPVQNAGGPIHWALDADKLSLMLPIIAREKDINILDKNAVCPVVKAAAKGWTEVVEDLIERGADLEIPTDKGMTALLLALRNGHLDIARRLVHTGRALNAQDYRGRTALMVAIKENQTQIVADLLAQKVDVNMADESGWRALHKAVVDDRVEWVRELIDAGAELDARDENGWTALHLACWKGHVEAVVMLLLADCDANVGTNDGNTPLMWALRGQGSRHRMAIERLLDHKVDVALANKEGVTALHKAAQCGYAKIVVKIMEAGADAMAIDNEGKTPVDVAKDDTIRHLLTNLQCKRELVKE
ncbi:Kidins220 [Symbiodinium microadriaticum]|nr:Kidins220 [Symbiodinium microadriaticum]